ncbi:MAG: hypothetical protein KME08_03780 [Aphanothece sp. CMT-3BRIN-NPC111]|nr:hypothetical protein [Aphanothece sp. CMT-3BRIN-NPC111]
MRRIISRPQFHATKVALAVAIAIMPVPVQRLSRNKFVLAGYKYSDRLNPPF